MSGKSKTVAAISKNDCTGCMMCGDICPKKAISFKVSKEDGFWYPEIDEEKCVNCGLCFKCCPSINEKQALRTTPIACYGAKSKNEDVRFNSTSGGFYSELAYKWIEDGGICVGAEYDRNNKIVHRSEGTKDGITALRQSKYAQSDISGTYSLIKKNLQNGIKVMFCGTPCQVAALKSYLGTDYVNLLTLDFVCCGICSPLVYEKYLEWLEEKYHSKANKIWFKNKENGWRQISTRVDFENGKHYIRTGSRDPFMIAFVTDALSMRKSCEQCKYRKLPHDSDFTLADFWGIEKVNPGKDDNMGLSAVIVNTEKGQALFEEISERLDYFQTTTDEITAGNFTIYKAKEPSKHREVFLRTVVEEGFEKAIDKYSSYSGLNRIQTDIKYYKGVLKSYIRTKLRGEK